MRIGNQGKDKAELSTRKLEIDQLLPPNIEPSHPTVLDSNGETTGDPSDRSSQARPHCVSSSLRLFNNVLVVEILEGSEWWSRIALYLSNFKISRKQERKTPASVMSCRWSSPDSRSVALTRVLNLWHTKESATLYSTHRISGEDDDFAVSWNGNPIFTDDGSRYLNKYGAWRRQVSLQRTWHNPWFTCCWTAQSWECCDMSRPRQMRIWVGFWLSLPAHG